MDCPKPRFKSCITDNQITLAYVKKSACVGFCSALIQSVVAGSVIQCKVTVLIYRCSCLSLQISKNKFSV